MPKRKTKKKPGILAGHIGPLTPAFLLHKFAEYLPVIDGILIYVSFNDGCREQVTWSEMKNKELTFAKEMISIEVGSRIAESISN